MCRTYTQVEMNGIEVYSLCLWPLLLSGSHSRAAADSARDGRCDILKGTMLFGGCLGGCRVIMKQCSCAEDAWEGSLEIKKPPPPVPPALPIKGKKHLVLDSQLVGVGQLRLSG